jgi:hypothetical protein
MRIHPYHDVAFGSLNSNVHADRSNAAHIIEEFDPWITPNEFPNYLSRPVVAFPVYDQYFELILGKVTCDDRL